MRIFILLFCSFINITQAAPPATVQPRLAMGFYYPSLNNISSKTDIQISLNYWMKELTNKINIENSYSILFDDIKKMSEAFQSGNIDMVVAPPLLLTIHFNRELLSDGFIGVLEKDEKDHLAIISALDTGSAPVNFFGKRLLLPNNELLAETLLEIETIKQYKQSYLKVFSQIEYKNKNQRIILDLFFNRADVAVVYESALNLMIEMNPQVAKKITVLKRFPLIARNYSFFHRDYAYQSKLKELSGQFSAEPRGKQILEVFKMSHIVTSNVKDLDRFDSIYQTYLKLKKNQLYR